MQIHKIVLSKIKTMVTLKIILIRKIVLSKIKTMVTPQSNTNPQSSFVQNKNINIVNSQNNEINDSDKYLTEMKLFAKYTVILFILGQILMIVTTGVANLSDADRAGIFVIFTPDFIIFFIFFLIAGNLQLASFTSFIMTIIYFIKWLIHKRK